METPNLEKSMIFSLILKKSQFAYISFFSTFFSNSGFMYENRPNILVQKLQTQ